MALPVNIQQLEAGTTPQATPQATPKATPKALELLRVWNKGQIADGWGQNWEIT